MSVSGFVGDGKGGQVWNKTGNVAFPTLSQKRKSGRNAVIWPNTRDKYLKLDALLDTPHHSLCCVDLFLPQHFNILVHPFFPVNRALRSPSFHLSNSGLSLPDYCVADA